MMPTPDEGAAVIGWPGDPLDEQDGEGGPGTLLLFADPFTFRSDFLLDRVAEGTLGDPGMRVIGGLASAAMHPGGNRLTVDGDTYRSGAVGAYLRGGSVAVGTVVSQGCRPVGRPYVVTRAEGQFLIELGGKPALSRFQETVAAATDEERELMRTGPQIGCVVNEARDEFDRGDFLVRGVLGADQNVGAIAVGDVVPVGRTVQFHIRDAASADEDLRSHLTGAEADAALLFTCNGRGQHLFGQADHDASAVNELIGPIPLAGCFCAGEVGPIGDQNFLHGFTASLALFRERSGG
jgi:small ligand-binding sensory domain FIST